MDNSEEKILNEIKQDMQDQSGLVIDTVNTEIEAMRNDQMNFYKQGLKKETDTYLEKELSDLRVYAAMKASQDKLKSKKALLSLRHQYAQEIEDTAEQKLKDFTASADYRGYLETALKQVEITKDGYFLVKEADTALMKDILSKQGLNNEVKTRYFAIGGFLYVDEAQHLEYSCDLSERLRDATDWFHGHSGFSIAEGGEN
jgi:vacuolar-type H+-ATPase subunit E/Vma4